MAEEHVVISSLIVECLVEDMERVAQQLVALEGVEVHGQENGQVVITIERETLDESHDLANSITKMSGVTGVSLIYANFEDDASLQGMFDALQERAKRSSAAKGE